MKNEEIKREWLQFVDTLPKYVNQTPKDVIADFWLQKLADREREICEEVEKLKISKTVCDPGGKIGNVYNKALEDVLKIIKK